MARKGTTGMARVEATEAETMEEVRVFATRRELVMYIADVTLQMRNLAREADLSFLAYLLEMAFQEAFDIANGEKGGHDGRRK